jgi:ribonucleoside-diphosphate reductase alpha chain
MLAALGLRYGTPNATEFAIEVQKTLALSAYRSSNIMAKERGAFTIFDAEREANNPMLLRIKGEDEELYNDIMDHGRRNIALLTIAPTGTTSLMTQTTSGIEPVFLPVYKRRRKVNPNDKNITVSFVDEVGDSWEEYFVFHHKFLTWVEAKGYDKDEVRKMSQEQIDELVKESPYYKATSNDVDWMEKIKMQGGIQKWVDHSISVTINLPADAPEELVGKLYIEAWKSGCKGVTVYRDGSRSGVLISNKKDEKKEVEQIHSLKRPKAIEADILRFRNNNESWIAFVGKVEGQPYEIFTGLAEDDVLPIPKKIEKGIIIKNKDEEGRKRYDFQYVNKYGYKTTVEGLSHKFAPEFWNYAKLISGILRYGMPIQQVVATVDSLHFDTETINTWKAGVTRSLKRYIEDGTKAKVGTICPECSQEDTIIYQDGCLTCSGCGYSKCG